MFLVNNQKEINDINSIINVIFNVNKHYVQYFLNDFFSFFVIFTYDND